LVLHDLMMILDIGLLSGPPCSSLHSLIRAFTI